MPDYRRALVGALLVLALLPASAAAYPGERAANNPTINRLVEHARGFWAARGLPTCAPAVSLADDLSDSDYPAGGVKGRADKASCHIWLLTSSVRDNQQMGGPQLCLIVLHEVGHIAGLDHAAAGIMAPDGGNVIGPCAKWSRPRTCLKRHRLVRRHHRLTRVAVVSCRD